MRRYLPKPDGRMLLDELRVIPDEAAAKAESGELKAAKLVEKSKV